MATYLLAWNPKRRFWKNLAKYSEKTRDGKPVEARWSCGKSKRIRKGDRVFLIRLGEEPKGIIGSGKSVTNAYEDLHWEQDKAALGKTGMFIKVEFDTLLNPEIDIILPREVLNDVRFSSMHWDTQISGVEIPDSVADELEKIWATFSTAPSISLAEEVTDEAIYEGAIRRISVNSYERNPEARRKCIKHYGTTCVICGFDFSRIYGKVGEGVIHIHHLRKLSEIGKEYKVDPIRDLRPVCPNCHTIIHRRKPAYTIEEARGLLVQTRQ